MAWRKKYRRIKKYLRKRYSMRGFRKSLIRTFGSKKKIRKAKKVSGLMRVNGVKTRLDIRPELKYTVFNPGSKNIPRFSDVNLDPGLSIIWSNNGVFSAGNPWFPQPTAGVGEQQLVGTKFNSLWGQINVRFFRQPGVNIQIFQFGLRIIMIREKQKNQDFSLATDFLYSNNYLSPIRSKDWTVLMDKNYEYTTGWTQNLPSVVNTLAAPCKLFRLLVPLKKTLYVEPGNDNLFPKKIYLLAFTTDANLMSVNVNCTYFYQDP